VVADDSTTPEAQAVFNDDSAKPRKSKIRKTDPEDDSVSAKRLDAIAEKMIMQTHVASGEQAKRDFRSAAARVRGIEKLASDWSSMLRQIERHEADARPDGETNHVPDFTITSPRTGTSISRAPRPPDAPLPAPVRTGTKPRTTPPPALAGDTDRRLAEVEQKIERVLRALEGASPSPPPHYEAFEPKPAKVPLFKKKKAPVSTYPKRDSGEAGLADPPEPPAPARPAAPPRPPEPPKPPTSPDGEN
jgi:hypothetical protein